MAPDIRKCSPCYSRDDITSGPVLGEISSHPNSSSSSFRLPEQKIKSEIADVSLNQEQSRINFLLSGTSNTQTPTCLIKTAPQCGCLPERCPAALHSGPGRHNNDWYTGLVMEQLSLYPVVTQTAAVLSVPYCLQSVHLNLDKVMRVFTNICRYKCPIQIFKLSSLVTQFNIG